MSSNPPAVPGASGPTPPAGVVEKLKQAIKEHGGKAAAWLFGGGFSTFADRNWLQIVPLPAELTFWGLFFSLLFSLIAIIISAALVTTKIQPMDQGRRRSWLITLSVGFVVGSLFFYVLFFFAEGWWKNPNLWFEFFYWFVEPAVYGLIFASFCAFLLTISWLVYDLLSA